jgi:hypothetical protein
MIRLRAGGRLVAVALAVLAAGCGDAPAPEPAQPIFELSTPWQPQPFRIRDDVLAAALTACRGTGPRLVPANARVVLADVRGADRVDFLFTVGTDEITCTTTASTGGAFEFAGGGNGAIEKLDPPPAGTARIEWTASGGATANGVVSDASTSVLGRVGPGVAAVDLIRSKGGRVRATTANGWFSAWWPTDDAEFRVQAIGPDGQPIGPPKP